MLPLVSHQVVFWRETCQCLRRLWCSWLARCIHVDKRLASMWTASPHHGAHGLKARSVGVTTARSSCASSVARTLNVSLPKVTRHFSVQLLLPWLLLCSAGGEYYISRAISGSGNILGFLGLWWLCSMQRESCWILILSKYFWLWVGLWHRRFVGSFCHVCQFCWLDTDLLLALYGSAEQLCLSAV